MSKLTPECLAKTDFPHLFAADPKRARCHLEALIVNPEALANYGDVILSRRNTKSNDFHIANWDELRRLLIQEGISKSSIDDVTLAQVACDFELLVELQFDLFSAETLGPSWAHAFEATDDQESTDCSSTDQVGDAVSDIEDSSITNLDLAVIKSIPSPNLGDASGTTSGQAAFLTLSLDKVFSYTNHWSGAYDPLFGKTFRDCEWSRSFQEHGFYVVSNQNSSTEHAAPPFTGDLDWAEFYIEVLATYSKQAGTLSLCSNESYPMILQGNYCGTKITIVMSCQGRIPFIDNRDERYRRLKIQPIQCYYLPHCGGTEPAQSADPTRIDWIDCVLDAALESSAVVNPLVQGSSVMRRAQFILVEEQPPHETGTQPLWHGCQSDKERRHGRNSEVPKRSNGIPV